METLGDKIRKLRKRAGYSQEELGFRVGVTRQTVSQWEMNALKPKYDKLKKLCEVLNVKPDYLMFDESETPNETAAANEREQAGLPKKIKALIAFICISFVTLLVLFIIKFFVAPTPKGLDSATSVSVNFDIVSVIGIIAGIILFVSDCLLIAFILKHFSGKK